MSIWFSANGWPVPPTVLILCVIGEILYLRGWHVIVRREQDQSAAGSVDAVSRMSLSSSAVDLQWQSWSWRGTFFLGAIFTFLLAASAPIDTLSGRFFWVHMVQHLLLLVVMAPLLVLSAPLLPLWQGLPNWMRRTLDTAVSPKVRMVALRVGHWLRQPVITCALLLVGTWIWHWPALYDLALRNDLIHDWCEHATFMAVSILFWTQVIPSPPLRPRLHYLGIMGCVGFAMAQNIVLAVLIGFAAQPLYAPYAHPVQWLGGLSPLQDQQFGAGIMWTFGDVPFGIAFSILVQRWLASFQEDSGGNNHAQYHS